MDIDKKVFSSDLAKSEIHHRSNLYELLRIVPAKPIPVKDVRKYTCDFIPNTDKCYIPKKKLRIKVRTVRSIRSQFESDTYAYLTSDLEAQQKYLLNKIRSGSSRDERTLKIAKKILNCDNPLSRSAWQMLININPEDHAHPRQFVLWNGKRIKVTGSHGGKKKLICNFDLGHKKISLKKERNAAMKANAPNKKKFLLRNSLAIKFKPGPLGRKKFLDDSHQKFQGDIELVDLPKIGLVVQPTYGTALEPTITHFINNLRNDDGTICEKWAEFAVSVLGEIDNSNAMLLNTDSVIFDLRYKYNQHRLLMRKDLDHSSFTQKITNTFIENGSISNDQQAILPEITDIVNKILDAVEININQNNMFTVDESFEETTLRDTNDFEVTTLSKDKNKRKYGELDRLDVTVIQLPANIETNFTKDCGNAYCSLGCVCDSLKSNFKFRQHCGREECMFDCKCDFSKYVCINSLDDDSTDLIPGIINIEDEINMRLAKEEQKFHQTVIVTGKQNILLKSEKRNSNLSKKYETRYKNMLLNNDNKKKRELLLSILKLPCENIEPWCMVHNLYKCFCKGKFTESSTALLLHNTFEGPLALDSEPIADSLSDKTQNQSCADAPAKQFLRTRVRQDLREIRNSEKGVDNFDNTTIIDTDITNRDFMKIPKPRNAAEVLNKDNKNTKFYLNTHGEIGTSIKYSSTSGKNDFFHLYNSDCNSTCSRVVAYEGRKYSNGHYKNTNLKIKEMEKNDRKLLERMNSILKSNSENEKPLVKEAENVKIFDIEQENRMAVDKDKSKEKTFVNKQVIQQELQTCPFAEVPNDETFAKFLYDNDVNCSNGTQVQRTPSIPQEKLVSWLEASYKSYKKRVDKGIYKTCLEPPKPGKVSLYAWDFILGRYRERKNLFLISKHKPYRIFMGVHTKNHFFESCININEIRFAELYKYPQTVKNLLTNATELKDNFCILRGLQHCWELVGSVTKVSKNDGTNEDTNESNPIEQSDRLSEILNDEMSNSCPERRASLMVSSNGNRNTFVYSKEWDSSKWFIMTVENDFSEIRFYKKGFFVKYESIVKAINVSRISGKTVRLSSQRCAENNSSPQFGVYAVPNANAYWVFIGPYELDDTLGVEIIKSLSDYTKLNRTRGFWIVTKKVDNLKVIDSPLSFMPLDNMKSNEGILLETHVNEENTSNDVTALEKVSDESLKITTNPESKKIVKPIKIRKTNGLYHLAKEGLLKKIVLQSPPKVLLCAPIQKSTIIAPPSLVTESPLVESILEHSIYIENVMALSTKDVLNENETNIKIAAVYSQREEHKENTQKLEKGMLILKPEEINRKLLERQQNLSTSLCSQDNAPSVSEVLVNSTENKQNDAGLSNNITPYTVDSNICIISDDESNGSTEFESIGNWKYVLIQCTNVSDLGWIWGRQKRNGLLSYIIPGGQYSEFCTEKKAFEELNSELSERIGPLKPFNLQWRVLDNTSSIQRELNPLDLNILQRVYKPLEDHGSQISTEQNIKTYSKKTDSPVESPANPAEPDKQVYKPPEDQASEVSTQLYIKTYSKNPVESLAISPSDHDKEVYEPLEDHASQISTEQNIKTYSKKTDSPVGSPTSPAEPDKQVYKPPEDQASEVSTQLYIKTYSKNPVESLAISPSDHDKEVYEPLEDHASQISTEQNIKTYSKKTDSPVGSPTSPAEPDKQVYKPPEDQASEVSTQLYIKTYSKNPVESLAISPSDHDKEVYEPLEDHASQISTEQNIKTYSTKTDSPVGSPTSPAEPDKQVYKPPEDQASEVSTQLYIKTYSKNPVESLAISPSDHDKEVYEPLEDHASQISTEQNIKTYSTKTDSPVGSPTSPAEPDKQVYKPPEDQASEVSTQLYIKTYSKNPVESLAISPSDHDKEVYEPLEDHASQISTEQNIKTYSTKTDSPVGSPTSPAEPDKQVYKPPEDQASAVSTQLYIKTYSKNPVESLAISPSDHDKEVYEPLEDHASQISTEQNIKTYSTKTDSPVGSPTSPAEPDKQVYKPPEDQASEVSTQLYIKTYSKNPVESLAISPSDHDKEVYEPLEDHASQISTEQNIKTYSTKTDSPVGSPTSPAEPDKQVYKPPEDQASEVSTQLYIKTYSKNPVESLAISPSDHDKEVHNPPEDQSLQISTHQKIKTYSKKNISLVASPSTNPAEPDKQVFQPPEDQSSQISTQLNIKTYSKKNTCPGALPSSAAEPDKEVYKSPENQSSQISIQLNIQGYSKTNTSSMASPSASPAESDKEFEKET